MRRPIKTQWLPLRSWDLCAAALALALATGGVTNALADLGRDSDDLFIETVPLNQRKVPSTVPPPFEFPSRAVPPFIPSNINVSNLVGNESEVSIAINPTDPLNMVAVGHSPGFDAMNTFWTTDGGEHWNLVALGDGQDGGAGCHRADPTVAFDSNGTVYAGYFTFFCGSATKTLFVARSDDGGKTYPQITAAVTDPTGGLDKDIIGTGPDPIVSGQQNVYIAYRLDVGNDAQLHLTTSTDGGLTFATDVIINDDSIAGDDRASFGMPAVGPNGELYVIWDDFSNNPNFSEIMVDASTDGGVTWGTDVQIGTTAVTRDNANGFSPIGGIRYHIPAQPDRGILAVPSIAVDRTGGPNDGRIYTAYTVVGGGGPFDTDIVMHFSDDHAATWSLPLRVNDDGGVRSQFLPWVSVDNCSGSSGKVALAWYDARNDATDETVQTFLGVSEDGGSTFAPSIQVSSGQSDQSLNNPDRSPNNYLEYIGIDVCGSIACMVWADNSVALSDLDFFSDCVPLINLPPVATCQPFSAIADDNCCVTVAVADIDGGSSDPNGASDIAVLCITAVDGTPVGCLDQVKVCGAGPHLVTLTITDLAGLSSSCDAEVNVMDGTQPSITVTLNRTVLWPPNHKLVDIVATVEVTDNCDPNPTFVLTSIINDEPDNDLGDEGNSGDIQGAVFGTPDVQFQLRSERSSLGDGRVYTIAYTASDESGNTRESTIEVIVPHDQKGAALPSIGFVSSGSSFAPEAQQFALVLLSIAPGTMRIPTLDATHVPSAQAYVGNTAGALRPIDRWLSDLNGDGLQDVAFFYATGLADEIAARSDREDGPLGMHYMSGDGEPYLVQDIFALGTPVPLQGYNDPTGAEGSLIASPLGETGFTGTYPNPFGRDVTLAFTLGRQERVSITIYDGRGARVCSVFNGSRPAGRHQVAWDGRDDGGRRVAAGVYYVQLVSGKYHSARNVVLLK